MGAWDTTAFGNDDAMDWMADLLQSSDPAQFLKSTLSVPEHDGYLEAPDGSRLIAAATFVAVACGAPSESIPKDLHAWFQKKHPDFTHLATTAQLAVQRVQNEDSELQELWRESDDFAGWSNELSALMAVLSGKP